MRDAEALHDRAQWKLRRDGTSQRSAIGGDGSVRFGKNFEMDVLGFHPQMSAEEIATAPTVIQRALKRFARVADRRESNLSAQGRLPNGKKTILSVRAADVSRSLPLGAKRQASQQK